MGRTKIRTPVTTDNPPKWLLGPVIFLLLLGLASSGYLLRLYIQVHSTQGGLVDSFCAISEDFNCVTVANSAYAAFLGIPIALYGVEFFLLALALAILSRGGFWSVRRWDSLLFYATAISLPVCGILAWISASRIRSFCLLCMSIYGAVALLFALLLVVGRKSIDSLLGEGPREIWQSLRRPGFAVGFFALLLGGVSQFFWVPQLVAAGPVRPEENGAWQGLPASGATIGPPSAPVKIEEFTDFQCPHCGKAHEMMMEILRRFPGKIFLEHKDFPLDNACNPMVRRPFHPHACQAATYARCAARQGKYWPFEAMLFRNRNQLDEESLRIYARHIGLEMNSLEECVHRSAIQLAISADIQAGLARGLRGTPTFFINGEMVVGIRPIEFWSEKIQAAERTSRPRSH